MKKMLVTAVCLAVLSGSVNIAAAQPAEPGNDRPRVEMQNRPPLSEKLSLTDEQKAQADKIREEGREKMKPLIDEQRALREKMDAVRKANMEEFEKILTPEQKKVFDEMKLRKGPRPGPRAGRHHRRPEPMPRHHGRAMPPVDEFGPVPGDMPPASAPEDDILAPEPVE